MRYFYRKDELCGTDCHEFFSGKWDGNFWNESSLYIYDEDFRQTGLRHILSKTVDDYSPYDATEIYPDDWENICVIARLTAEDALNEIAAWVKKAFDEHGMFTILGI